MDSLWNIMERDNNECLRESIPNFPAGDNMDYYSMDLCRGLKVCGMQKATSSGVFLRNGVTGDTPPTNLPWIGQ